MPTSNETPLRDRIHSCKWCQQLQLDFGSADARHLTTTAGVSLPMPFAGTSIDDEHQNALTQRINQFLTSVDAVTCAFSQAVLKALGASHGDHQPVKKVFTWLGGIEFYGNDSRFDLVNYYWYKSKSLHFYLDTETYRIPSNALQEVKKWLIECEASHEDCQSLYKDNFVPKRLLQIRQDGGDWNVCLVYPKAACAFTALSYCWGGVQDVLYTSATRVEWETTGLTWEELPRILQDAMLVTYVLGIEFIWIDALCILQDDNYDKETQIAQMPQIYNSAAVTLSALGMSSVRDALFETQRLPLLAATNIFGLPSVGNRNDCDGVILVPSEEVKAITLEEDIWTEPLDKRAWAFQETLLSKRLLRFTSSSMRLQCQNKPERSLDEVKKELLLTCYPVSPPIRRMQHLANFNFILKSGQFHCPNGRKKETPEADVDQPSTYPWHSLVEEYSNRRLSFHEDRALAISGIVERIAARTGDKYCAGIWRSCFTNQLAWCISENVQEEETSSFGFSFSRVMSAESNLGWHSFQSGGAFTLPQRLGNKPKQRQRCATEGNKTLKAPSWSWTAVSGPIKFRISHIIFTLEILDVQVQPSILAARFGNVDYGRLTARGPIKHDSGCNCQEDSQDSDSIHSSCLISLKLGEDESVEAESSQKAICLQLRRKPFDTWTRLGLSYTSNNHWLRVQTVVIE